MLPLYVSSPFFDSSWRLLDLPSPPRSPIYTIAQPHSPRAQRPNLFQRPSPSLTAALHTNVGAREAMTSSSNHARKALSKIASNRLQKELAEWQVNPPTGFKHKVTDNLQRWVIDVSGAPGTIYAGETYQLQVDFPEHYPMEAPQVIFSHPAPLHPHIYSNGHICLDILYDSWSPAMTVSSICISILSMLSSCKIKQRPTDNDRYVKNCRNGGPPRKLDGGSMMTKCEDTLCYVHPIMHQNLAAWFLRIAEHDLVYNAYSIIPVKHLMNNLIHSRKI